MDGQAANADNAERCDEASPSASGKRMDASPTPASSSLKENGAAREGVRGE